MSYYFKLLNVDFLIKRGRDIQFAGEDIVKNKPTITHWWVISFLTV